MAKRKKRPTAPDEAAGVRLVPRQEAGDEAPFDDGELLQDPEFQKVLLDEAAAMSEKNSRLQQEREASMLEDIRKSGKTAINESPDRAAFAAKMGPALQKLEGRWGAENLKRVRAFVDAN